MESGVYILTQGYEYHNKISWQDAMQMLYRKSQPVEVILYSDHEVKPGMYAPKVMKLRKDVRKFYGKKVNWSPENLFKRDDYTCQYCGTKLSRYECTIDHIMPQSRSGKTNFENCVTCCSVCNNLKDNRTPNEAHMFLKRLPYTPTIAEFFFRNVERDGIFQTLKELGIY
jgi:5-methylcytosine-specific restriction endonuclease McrA